MLWQTTLSSDEIAQELGGSPAATVADRHRCDSHFGAMKYLRTWQSVVRCLSCRVRQRNRISFPCEPSRVSCWGGIAIALPIYPPGGTKQVSRALRSSR